MRRMAALVVFSVFGHVFCGATVSYAQTQKVIYPDGRVVYETIQIAPTGAPRIVPWSGTPAPGIVCDPCKSTSQTCSGCTKGCIWPNIVSSNVPPCGVDIPAGSVPIPIIKDGDIDTDDEGNLSFYKDCWTFTFDVEVPYIKKNTKTIINFKNVTYTYLCCTYTVCVPCECVNTSTTTCAKKTIPNVTLIKKIRQDLKTIDVYVTGLKGFPKEWVICFEIDEATFQSRFKSPTLTKCP